MRQGFLIELLDDTVISARAATHGGHGSLDYIPGANLLGAAAARIYAELGDEKAYTAFHSGRLRFGNALPYDDAPSFPMPLSWQRKKGDAAAVEEGRLVWGRRRNYQHKDEEYERGVSAHRMEAGYLTPDGRVLAPSRRLRMKTAIDPTTGRARDGQLFGYTSLPRGSRFAFALEGDVEKELFNRVADALSGELRLGRSRSAEYGRARVSAHEWEDPALAANPVKGRHLTLWLLSDLAVQDNHGVPTFQPRLDWLGDPDLPKAELVPEKSFLQTRAYAPFNGHYQTRELERPVIAQGSVLCFDLGEQTLTDEQLLQLRQGIGLYRQAGLGRVWVDPPLLRADAEAPVPLGRSKTDSPTGDDQPSLPDHPLAHWLHQRVEREREARGAELAAAAWIAALPLLYQSARLLASAPVGTRMGPSPSQWGRVLELAKRRSISSEALSETLFGEQHAICKGEEWTAEIHADAGDGARHFRHWLERLVDQERASPHLAGVLARVARRGIDQAREEERPAGVEGGRSQA